MKKIISMLLIFLFVLMFSISVSADPNEYNPYCTVICDVCGKEAKKYTRTSIKPTCQEEGWADLSCHQYKVPVVDHDPYNASDDPGCTHVGYEGRYTCFYCNIVLEEGTVIPALGHQLSSKRDGKEPTCTSNGYTPSYECSRFACHYFKDREVIPALGHKVVIDHAVTPTCTETGLTEGSHCSVCGEVFLEQKERPIKHIEPGSWDIIKKSTCIEAGMMVKSCAICHTVIKAQTIKATGEHTEIIDQEVSPTCTKAGLTEGKHCSVCEEVIVPQKKINATGHTEAIVKGVLPTCNESGWTDEISCCVCDEILVPQTEIKATGHTTKTVGKMSATYFAKGHTGKEVCKDCNEVVSKGKAIAQKKLKTPKATIKVSKKKLTVKYKKVTDATGFQVKYKLGKKTVTKTYTTNKTKTITIKNLKKGTYKVYVRAFVKSGSKKAYGDWTKVKKVRVK